MTTENIQLLRVTDPRSGARLCEAQQPCPREAPSNFLAF
jgi:hypothetical protein